MNNIFSEGPRFDPGSWHFDSWINIKYYFYFTFYTVCVVAQLVDYWSHKPEVMSSILPDTIKYIFFKIRRRASRSASEVFEYKQGFSPHLHPFTNPHCERRDQARSGLVFSLVRMARDCALTHSATRLH